MQLSKQYTWISLNLTRISKQARRWVEGVFSSSMYASSNQMCKSESPKAGHLLFISPLSERAVGHFYWAEIGGIERLKGPNMARGGVNSLFKKSANSLEQEVSK